MLGSLTFASAKQLAGQAINDIADFAARWAMSVAKKYPHLAQMMKDISSILKGIIVDCLKSTQGCDSTSPSTTSHDGCGGHDTPHIQVSPVAHHSTGHTHNDTHTHEPTTTTTHDEHPVATPTHEDTTSNDAVTTAPHNHNEHKEPVITTSEPHDSSCDETSTEGCQDETTTTETASGTEHTNADEGNIEGGSVKIYDKYTGECVDEVPIVYYEYYYGDDCGASCAVVPEVNNDINIAQGVVTNTTSVLNQKVEEVKIEQMAVKVAGEELQVVDNKISNLLSGKDANKNQLTSLLGQKEVLTRRIASA